MVGGDAAWVGAAEVGTIGGMRLLGKIGPSWLSSLKTIELGGKLAKPAVGAAAVWLLAQPWDDDAISKAWNAWRTVNLKLSQIRTVEWDSKLTAIREAWPEGDDSKAFKQFMAVVKHEVLQLETAASQMANAVQSAQSDLNKIINTAGLIFDVLLGIIIAAELMQLTGKGLQAAGAGMGPFGGPLVAAGKAMEVAAEGTKATHGMLLMGSTITAITGATAVLIFSLGNLSGLMSANNQFPQPQANLDSDGADGKTDFDDIRRRSVSRSGKDGWSY